VPVGEPINGDPQDWIVLDALWSGVVNDFENDARHQKFLDQARHVGALPEAARRYRTLLDDPDRGPAAKKRLDVITIVATHELLATKTEPPPKAVRPWIWMLGAAVSLGLLGWMAWLMWTRGFL